MAQQDMDPMQQQLLLMQEQAAAALRQRGDALPVDVMSMPSKTQSLERGVGLAGRAMAEGVASTVGLAYDPLAYIINQATGAEIPPLTAQVRQALTDLGVPDPETATERVVQTIGSAMTGAGVGAKMATGASQFLTGAGEAAAKAMGSGVGQQVAGGAAAGGASQIAAEMGGGPAAQFGAGLAGGIAGGRVAGLKTDATQSVTPQAIKEAEDIGIRVMTSDVMPPKTFVSKWLQRAGEMVPGAGTGPVRAAQQQERIDASADLLRAAGISEGAAGQQASVQSVFQSFKDFRKGQLSKYSKMKGDVIKNLDSAGPVNVSRTVSEIDDQIAQLKSLRSNQYDGVISVLDNWKKAITGTREVTLPDGTIKIEKTGQPLTNIEQIRKDIGEAFTDPNMASVRSVGEKALNRIYAPLREDMGEFIKQNGGKSDYNKWRVANKNLSDMAGDLQIDVLRRALSKGDATPELIRPLLFSANASDVKALYKNLSPEGKKNARTVILQEALNKVGGDLEKISPDRFKQQLIKMSTPIGVFFNGTDLKAVEGLVRALKMTERGAEAAVSTPTGLQGVPVIASAFLADILGSAGSAITGGATIGVSARIYESAAVRNALLKIPQTVVGSQEEAELIKRVIDASRALAVSESQKQ